MLYIRHAARARASHADEKTPRIGRSPTLVVANAVSRVFPPPPRLTLALGSPRRVRFPGTRSSTRVGSAGTPPWRGSPDPRRVPRRARGHVLRRVRDHGLGARRERVLQIPRDPLADPALLPAPPATRRSSPPRRGTRASAPACTPGPPRGPRPKRRRRTRTRRIRRIRRRRRGGRERRRRRRGGAASAPRRSASGCPRASRRDLDDVPVG